MGDVIKVLIVDDHSIVRFGLNTILKSEPGIQVVGEASDGVDAVHKALDLNPDVILMDIMMPRATGLEATVNIREKLPSARVLILTVSDKEQDLFQALRLGAMGYLLKSSNIDEVVDAIKRTYTGEAVMSPHIAMKLAAELTQKASGTPLSAREKEVLSLVGEGLTNTEISRRLFINESTVRTYLHRLLEKLHLKNRMEAARYAQEHII